MIMKQENIKQIVDIWLALNTVLALVFGFSLLGGFIGYIVYSFVFHSLWIIAFFIILINLISFKFIYNVWDTYSKGYIIDIENNKFSFPANDVENSILEIMKLKPFFNMAKREELLITDIIALNNETQRWTTKSSDGKTQKHIKYLLNISGKFGSRQLEFSSKQKRDECRTLLSYAKKKLGSKFVSNDMNLDLQ